MNNTYYIDEIYSLDHYNTRLIRPENLEILKAFAPINLRFLVDNKYSVISVFKMGVQKAQNLQAQLEAVKLDKARLREDENKENLNCNEMLL